MIPKLGFACCFGNCVLCGVKPALATRKSLQNLKQDTHDVVPYWNNMVFVFCNLRK